MRDWIVAVLVGLFSVGWIVPFYLGTSACLTGFEQLLRGTEGANSFPYLKFGHGALQISAVWCLASAVCWTTCGTHRLLVLAKTTRATDMR